MPEICSDADPCIHFFPGMGFRPAVHAVERGPYGDQVILIVGDDSALEGKVPPGHNLLELPVDPYAPLLSGPGGSTPSAIALGGSPAGGGGWTSGIPVPIIWGGSGGSHHGGGGDGGGSIIVPPTPFPPLPPLAPVPGPEAGVLMATAAAALVLARLRRATGRGAVRR